MGSKTKKEFPQISNVLSLQENSWKMGVLYLTTISRKSQLSIWCCVFAVEIERLSLSIGCSEHLLSAIFFFWSLFFFNLLPYKYILPKTKLYFEVLSPHPVFCRSK